MTPVTFVASYPGEPFDVALLLDVLEHFDPETGTRLVTDLLRDRGSS